MTGNFAIIVFELGHENFCHRTSGFIGCHLVDGFCAGAGHRVTGCDLGLFKGCEWDSFERPDIELIKDIGSIKESELSGHDAICHLAAISNDPMGDLDPAITLRSIGQSVALANARQVGGDGRFLYAGSCSVYRAGDKLDFD